MIKKITARALSLMLCASLLSGYTPLYANDTGVSISAATSSKALAASKRGQAIVMLTIPDGADSPLIHEGTLSNDPRIRIRNVMSFGSVDTKKSLFYCHVSSQVCGTDELIKELKHYKNVAAVTANYIRRRSASLSEGLTTALHTSASGAAADIGSPDGSDPLADSQWILNGSKYAASESFSAAGADIGYSKEDHSDNNAPIVAVVDDGVDYTHEDLADRMWINPYKSLEGKYGYDTCNEDADPMPTNQYDSHGTSVAGIIAAQTDNGIGIAGISENAKIMSLKMFDYDNEEMSGSIAAEIDAYEYIYKAQKLGANIAAVNCSFGTTPVDYNDPEIDSFLSVINPILTKLGAGGALLVYSAGNESTDTDEYKYGAPFQYDRTYVLLAGTTTQLGHLASFSNYGKKSVDLMAPGCSVLTTVMYDNFIPEFYDEEKRNALCASYNDFLMGADGFYTYSEVFGGMGSAIELSHSDNDFYSGNTGSLKVTLKRTMSVSPYAYMILYDVTNVGIDPRRDTFISFDYTNDSESMGEDWESSNIDLKDSTFFNIFSIKGKTYLGLDIRNLFERISDHIGEALYFDNFAISVPDPDTSQFGRYGIASGTSFSAPCVCGAIARLASMYPDDNSLTRRKKLLEGVKKSDALAEYCISGGILNLSSFAEMSDIKEDPVVYKIKKILLSRKKATLQPGQKLALEATVSPSYATNKNIRWSISNKKYAAVNKKGVVRAKKAGQGHTVKVTAAATDGSSKKATCTIKVTIHG